MEQCPLDEEIAVETFESIQAKLEEVQEVLSKRYGLPKVQAQFRNALQRKLAAEEIYDEPDVQLWQSLFGAVLARAKYGAEIIKEPNRVETCPTQAAAGGLSYQASTPTPLSVRYLLIEDAERSLSINSLISTVRHVVQKMAPHRLSPVWTLRKQSSSERGGV